MKPDKYNRRKFLGAMSVSTAGGILINTLSPFSAANAQTNSFLNDGETKDEYLFMEGLTYLNTGTLGPCRRATIDESKKIWEALESLPVKFYGKFGAESLAEKTRTIASRFLGCGIDEMLITTSTANGMNAIAHGDVSLKYYPTSIEILSTTAVANMLTKNYDKAIDYLKQAEKLNPKDFIVLNNIAQGYKLKGDKENAIRYYELTEKYGDDEAKQQARKYIKELKK